MPIIIDKLKANHSAQREKQFNRNKYMLKLCTNNILDKVILNFQILIQTLIVEDKLNLEWDFFGYYVWKESGGLKPAP